MKLTFIVPGLLGIDKMDFRRILPLKEFGLTNLYKIASRCDFRSEYPNDILQSITEMFDLDSTQISLAVASRNYDMPDDCRGLWLRADPVHLQAGQQNLGLIDAQQLNISADEAAEMTTQINSLSDGSWRIDAPSPQRWYLKTDTFQNLITQPLARVVGSQIGNQLPTGEDSSYWMSLLSEIQMLLHHLPVNQNRENQGELPVNSIWLWGEGETDFVPAAKWNNIWSDEETALGLAQRASIPHTALASNPDDCFNVLQYNANYLLVFSKPYYQVQYGILDWNSLAKSFDQIWLAPLIAKLVSGQIEQLKLIIPGQAMFQLSKNGMKRFWWPKKVANRLINYFNNN